MRLTQPSVGFNPTSPFIDDGQTTDPSVSVPTAAAAKLAATAAPDPLDDPQLVRSSAYGLRTSPPTALHPLIELEERIFAHSLRLVLPRITAPCARRLATSGASRSVTLSLSARLPAVVAIGSLVSILSLISTGTPSSGPSGLPLFRRASAARACAIASGLTAITARSVGPVRSIAAMRAR